MDGLFFDQCGFVKILDCYIKVLILLKLLSWGLGQYWVKFCNFIIDLNLYLFYFGLVDVDVVIVWVNDGDCIVEGWINYQVCCIVLFDEIIMVMFIDGDQWFVFVCCEMN